MFGVEVEFLKRGFDKECLLIFSFTVILVLLHRQRGCLIEKFNRGRRKVLKSGCD